MQVKNLVFLGLSLTLLLIFFSNLVTGDNNAQVQVSEDKKAMNVVELFWQFTEEGEFEKAHSLTTKSFSGTTIEVEDQEPVEKWLHRLKIKHLYIEMHKMISPQKCVIRVRVQKGEKKYYLFHDLVKDESGEWKIISTSN